MYRVIIGKDVIKESKKILKPSQRKKLTEFFKALEENPFPKPPFDVKPVKGEKTEKTNILIALELATTEYFTQFTGRKI